jgi:Uma2 family endonuclease
MNLEFRHIACARNSKLICTERRTRRWLASGQRQNGRLTLGPPYAAGVTAMQWPDHLLTVQEWDELPEEINRRCELAEGVLVMVPSPTALHQRAATRLAAHLDDQLPDDLTALADVDVLVEANDPVTVRRPDVIVDASKHVEQNPPRFHAADVQLAVEIVSPGTGRRDRVTKFAEYADAGIPNYWIIELDQPTLIAYVLVDGYYEIVAHTGRSVTLSAPAPLTVDVRTLTSRR